MKKKVLHEQDAQYVINRYINRIKEHGLTADSLKSGSNEKQDIRHAVHISSLRSEQPNVLDIGCGMASFLQFMNTQHIVCNYTGYDIVSEYIEYCKKTFITSKFELCNVFEDGINGTYDNIILSQVLNNKYSLSDNMEVMQRMMTMCYEHCNIGFSIDMMSDYVDFKSEELYYYNPEKIFAFAKTLSKRVIIRHDYRPYEFCVQVFKPDAAGFVA